MLNSSQLCLPKVTKFFRDELRTSTHLLRQENRQNPNLLGKSPTNLFEAGSKLATDDDAYWHDCVSQRLLRKSPATRFEAEGSAQYPKLDLDEYSLEDISWCALAGEACLSLISKKEPKYFLTVEKPGEAGRAESVVVIDVTDKIPDDPEKKQAFCRGLAQDMGFSFGYPVPCKLVFKLCATGGGGVPLDLTGTYVDDSSAIENLLAFARAKILTDLIGQAQADCANEGKEAEAEFEEMVNFCPREVLANFHSVELLELLFLQDKVKEDFAKLQLSNRPEIIDPAPAAFINHPVPPTDWKPTCSSTAEGGEKCYFNLPDLNQEWVEEEAGENAVPFAIGEEEKTKSKKRKAEGAGGELLADHVLKMPPMAAAAIP